MKLKKGSKPKQLAFLLGLLFLFFIINYQIYHQDEEIKDKGFNIEGENINAEDKNINIEGESINSENSNTKFKDKNINAEGENINANDEI